MGFAFNPFTGNFDAKGSGGGGSSYIDGEVQNFSALPETLGTPAVDSAYLVREAEGTWLLNRKPAGIYIRTANTGTRASDWTHASAFPDVFNDANLVVYSNGDSSKNLAFNVGGITTGTTRTITVPDKNITLDDAGDSRTPSSHSSSHAAGAAARFGGQVAGITSNILIVADNVGTAGNSITLTFDGVDDIDTVLAAWNAANTSNTAGVITGDSSQVPDNGEEITLSGGVAAGSDPITDPVFDSVGIGGTPEIGRGFHQRGSNGEKFLVETTSGAYGVFQLLTTAPESSFAVATEAVSVPYGNGSNGSDVVVPENDQLWVFGLGAWTQNPNQFVFGNAENSDVVVIQPDGKVGIGIGNNDPQAQLDVAGNVIIKNTDNGTTATFDAQNNLSENRVYTLPDADGVIVLDSALGTAATADIGTGSTEVAAGDHGHGNLTTDGKIGSTSGLPLKTGTAGVVEAGAFGTGAGTFCAGDDARLSDARTPTSHTHGNITNGGLVGTTANLPLKTGTGGIVEAGAFGTGAGEFSEGNHTHTQLHDRSHAITSTSDHTAGNWKVFHSNGSGEVVELALGDSGKVLQSNGASAAPTWETPSGGVSAIGTSAADILSVSGSDIVADDLGADKLWGWDDSAGKAIGFTIGSGLTVTDDTLSASGGIGGGTGSTDNAILRADGTGGSTAQDSAFVIPDNYTASPNNTVNHASIQATGGSTNVSVSIVTKGTGAFMLSVPDGTTAGGNARGAYAVDLQTERGSNLDVASGPRSVVGGGYANRSSANYTTVAGGWQNRATQDYAVVCGGQTNNASDFYAFVGGGIYNTASGDNAVVCGGGSLGAASGNTASADMSAVLGGLHGLADRYGLQAHGAGRFSSTGDAQRIRAVLRCKTTTDSAVEMFLDGSSTRLTVPSGKVIAMLINITGVKSDGSAVAHYVRQYAIKNVGGTTSEVYAAVTVGTDNAASTSIALSANDTNDALKIEVTGIASETWRWVASVDAVEVAYGS